MSKKYRVFLNGKKRSDLKRLVNTGADKARKLTRRPFQTRGCAVSLYARSVLIIGTRITGKFNTHSA